MVIVEAAVVCTFPPVPPEHVPFVFVSVPVAEIVTAVRQFEPPLVVEPPNPANAPEELTTVISPVAHGVVEARFDVP